MRTRSVITLLLITLVTTAAAPAQRTRTMSSPIREDALRAHVKFLSDDRLEGRGTGAKGGETAALYIAEQFEAMGLKGAGAKGSFWQPVSLVGVKADPKTELRINGPEKAEAYKFADEFVAFTGAQTERVSVNADLIFVGYGINAPEQNWNDYKGGAEDYRGKILVMMVNDPPATTAEPDLFGARRLTYYGRWTYKFEEAARRGAAGVILIHTDESAGYGWNVIRTSNGSWRFDIARTDSDKTPFLKVRSWITDEAAHRMFSLAGHNLDDLRRQAASRDFKPVKLNLTGSIDLNSEVKRVEAPNVVAILPGRDPKLRDEYVVFTAHWDHLGIGAPNKNGDTIYNGALDNATGVASVLEIARVLSTLPAAERPRRSILFLIPTAEEQGLIGAEWYTRHPLVPINKTAANVNLDSMNILGPTHDFVPLGAERSTLKAVVEGIARERGLRISPDPRPEQGSFYRSDHFPFAKAGVPSISLKEGSDYVGRPKDWGQRKFQEYNQAHYHQPSDEFRDDWDFKGMIQEADFAMAIGRRVADAPAMQKFNPNDEFAKNSKR
ncbi:MAG TPA: M28 family peptidase [Pyrinomonadaceae bacterium]|nr:M28 family peptidase [Pyrinomonadaceae bacterium]